MKKESQREENSPAKPQAVTEPAPQDDPLVEDQPDLPPETEGQLPPGIDKRPESTAVAVPSVPPRIAKVFQRTEDRVESPQPPTGGSEPPVSTPQDLPDIRKILTVPEWIALHPMLGPYLAEAIGTFFFVLAVALVEVNNPILSGRKDTNISPIPIGFALMVVVLALGPVSGGHFNPAVTAAVLMYTRKDFAKYFVYIIVQCGAALGAGLVAMIIEGTTALVVPGISGETVDYIRKGFFAELIYTFALATVVLNIFHSKQEVSVFYGLGIAMVVAAGSASVGGVSGGVFNPAAALGLQLSLCLAGQCDPLFQFWLYWIAPLVGAGLAVLVFSGLSVPEEEDSSNVPPAPPLPA